MIPLPALIIAVIAGAVIVVKLIEQFKQMCVSNKPLVEV